MVKEHSADRGYFRKAGHVCGMNRNIPYILVRKIIPGQSPP